MATVRKIGKSYQIRVYDGYNLDGKQIERRKTWTPPPEMSEKKADKEAQRQAYLFEEQVKNGLRADGKMKLGVFANLWIENYANQNLRANTIRRYRSLLKRINPVLGHISLDRISPMHLLDFYKKLAEDEPENCTYQCIIDLKTKVKTTGMTLATFSEKSGVSLTTLRVAKKKTPIAKVTAEKISAALDMPLRCCFEPTEADRKLAPTTVRHYHSLLSDILGAAVKWQYIPYNPCSRIDPPKKNDPEVLYLSDVQTKHFVKLLDQAPGIYRRAILLLLLTGMRRGELLGLEWRDIDWKASTISINRTSQYLPKHGIVTEETKTKKSKRLVEVSPQALQVLQEQYMWQQIQQHRMKCEWVETGKVITNEDGTLMRPNRLTAWFRRFVDKTDLPPIKLHSLRHTYATLLLAHGAPITAVSAQLGHANVATTANIYAHAIKSAQIASARIIGDLLDGYI